eukprot:1862482-Alexandrium_andersonii.AAC.1
MSQHVNSAVPCGRSSAARPACFTSTLVKSVQLWFQSVRRCSGGAILAAEHRGQGADPRHRGSLENPSTAAPKLGRTHRDKA